MKRKGLIVVVLVVSLFSFIGSVGSLIVACNIEKISTSKTTEFSAIVTDIKVVGSGASKSGKIYTEEYGDKLNIFYIKDVADMDGFSSLKEGQRIFFRIENVWLD